MREKGTFKGYMKGDGSSKAEVFVQRVIPDTEQTTDDGKITRIEAGRSLRGSYFTAADRVTVADRKIDKNFTVQLTGAMRIAAYAGMSLVACLGLLAF